MIVDLSRFDRMSPAERARAIRAEFVAAIQRLPSPRDSLAKAPGENGLRPQAPAKEERSEGNESLLDLARRKDKRCATAKCGHYRGVCDLVFPQVKGCRSIERYRQGWLTWLAEPSQACPRGIWPPASPE